MYFECFYQDFVLFQLNLDFLNVVDRLFFSSGDDQDNVAMTEAD
jgi:hypothetical protein